MWSMTRTSTGPARGVQLQAKLFLQRGENRWTIRIDLDAVHAERLICRGRAAATEADRVSRRARDQNCRSGPSNRRRFAARRPKGAWPDSTSACRLLCATKPHVVAALRPLARLRRGGGGGGGEPPRRRIAPSASQSTADGFRAGPNVPFFCASTSAKIGSCRVSRRGLSLKRSSSSERSISCCRARTAARYWRTKLSFGLCHDIESFCQIQSGAPISCDSCRR